MRTQKESAATIIEQGADYVLQVNDKNEARRHGGLQGTRRAPQAKAPLQAAGQREPNRLKPAISFTVKGTTAEPTCRSAAVTGGLKTPCSRRWT